MGVPTEFVGPLKTTSVKIKLKESTVPNSVITAKRESVPLLPPAKEDLDRMVK